MITPPLPVVRAVVRGLGLALRPPVPVAVQRRLLEAAALAPLPAGTQVDRLALAGRPAERVRPVESDPGRAVLLLHGGAFQTCSPRTHRVLAAHLARAAGCAVWTLDYRLAPEHPWPAAVDDARAAFDELAATARTAVVGDSAGGTLALLLARERQPYALGLISPLVDLTLASSRGWPGADPLLCDAWVSQGTAGFVGKEDARALSPLHGELGGLPPMMVHVSEHERLRPEGELLVDRVRAAGGRADLVLLPDLWHDAHLLAHLVPAAAAALHQLGGWLRARS